MSIASLSLFRHCRVRSPGAIRTIRAWSSFGVLVGAMIGAFPAAYAGEVKLRVVGFDALRPSALASVGSADRHAYTTRELDPLVPVKYTTISGKADKDVTLAIYGSGDANAFGLGAVVRLAGGRAVPSTVVLPPGVPVFFRNDDPFIHHLVGPDLERDLKPGESHKMVPKGKGAVAIGDTLIPSVKAWVVVEDGVIANRQLQPDGTAKLTFEGGPAEYTVKAFFEGTVRAATPVLKVPANGVLEVKEPLVVGTAPAASASGK